MTEHHETPGLSDKIELRLSGWITHFAGKNPEVVQMMRTWAVKNGGDFDQFTGATIISRAGGYCGKTRAGLYAQTLPATFSTSACGE